jgi:hypothetical protein
MTHPTTGGLMGWPQGRYASAVAKRAVKRLPRSPSEDGWSGPLPPSEFLTLDPKTATCPNKIKTLVSRLDSCFMTQHGIPALFHE